MSFYDVVARYASFDFPRFLEGVTERDVAVALDKDAPGENDFLVLLSPRALPFLEQMARRASELTVRHFGKIIHLYAPLYLGNFCDNECVYCGFRHTSAVARKKLSPEDLAREAAVLSEAGMRHLLLLTGESRKETPVGYIRECVRVLRGSFSSLSIEVYPLEEHEYRALAEAGVDGLTLYQETYDEETYRALHPKGPKRDYRYRLDAPERGCRASLRAVTVGALLGLSDSVRDIFLAGLHADYLQRKYPSVEAGLSLPRVQGLEGYRPASPVDDRRFVQFLLAFRLFMPRAGIALSTREGNDFRKNLVGLGVTRMSAGSRTEVGGYSLPQEAEGQFGTRDKSSVEEVRAMVRSRGYQPVMKDWETL